MSRVLVVDDEQRICRFITRSLTTIGFQADSAANGAEAIRIVREAHYDLVILDLLMPGIDGYDALAQLLRHDPLQKVMVLSAITEVDSKVRCLRMGAVDYLAKPFAIAELLERVKRRAEEPSITTMTRWLDVGRVRLDLQRREIMIDDRTMPLSEREFILLDHLMRHANQVCTRGELLADVWGYSFDPGSNVVDVCIRRLRNKLQPDLIETVRNVGYCFIAS
ncbi:response regulator transcription factor [Jatrophihabitans telluris]|uniref:Response regulator transcription factor n=1 Tax=Jatrophihabitans telluris TaxID=2038343 RepID=A0ABY4R033_9ACTN|nr:response regulator transcription factor [Jatrophihabitans telluris]UQX88807.1 response regulator transcription factor [Jatrophihabitans telluris]